MSIVHFLEPKTITIDERDFIISKFDALLGLEIISQIPTTAWFKQADWKFTEPLILKILSCVGVTIANDQKQALTNRHLINSHCGNWETLIKLLWAMMENNVSFFQNGRLSTSLEATAQNIVQWISKISTALSGQSLLKAKQNSTNSEPSIL